MDRRALLRGAATLAPGVLLGSGVVLDAMSGGDLLSAPAHARDDELRTKTIPEDLEQRSRRRNAVRRACDWLAKKQRRDGGFGDNDAVVALTSLSVLALMADGSLDGRGRYGRQVRRGLDFLIKLIEQPSSPGRWHEGYFFYPFDRASRMHGQGYATLAIASALGTAGGARYRTMRSVVAKAIQCARHAQSQTGGFGYLPKPQADHEGSVTVAVAQGLRAASNAGLTVPPSIVKRGLTYLRRSQKTDGSFKYSMRQDQSTYALTAAAMSSFFLFGEYTDRKDENGFDRAFDYMRRSLRRRGAEQSWYYYGHFYAAWAYWQRGGNNWDPGTSEWGYWQSIVYHDLLFRRQSQDGSFEEEGTKFDYGRVLPTAFAALTLAIPEETVPVFQR